MTIITCTIDTDTHKVVPIEPSPKMVDATFNDDLSMMSHNKRNKHIYGAMVKAAPPYPADTGWISVDDRLPLEHAGVLISFLDQYQYPQIVDGFYFKLRNGELVWNQNTEFCEAQGGWEGASIEKQDLKVTHWMPLPPAPKGE